MDNLKKIANDIRKNLVKLHHDRYATHTGSGLSVVEILVTLYFSVSDINKDNVDSKDRDRIILSKGHAAAALYCVLKEKSIISEKELLDFYKNGQYLAGHPSIGIKGVEVSSGSLGHGFPMGVGIALANKIDKKKHNVYCVVGDGECNEGSIFESAIIASRLKLDNLFVIIDSNGLQGYDCTKDICPVDRLTDVWKSLGFNVKSVDGHNFSELKNAITTDKKKNMPTAIIAKTVKGKGISFMENRLEWHYKSPNKEQLQQALEELSKEE